MTDTVAVLDTKPKWLDNVGAFVLCTLTVCFAIVTIGPYFGLLPGTLDLTVAANQNAVVNNLFIAAVSFFIGASVATRKKDDNIGTLATTVSAQAATISPSTAVPLAPNESVTVKADK